MYEQMEQTKKSSNFMSDKSKCLKSIRTVLIIVFCIVHHNLNRQTSVIMEGGDVFFDLKSIEMVKKMPPWIPAHNEGRAVKCFVTIRVHFKRD